MEEEVQYCDNCKRNINAKNYVIHTAFCARQIQLCDRCSEPVPRTERKHHEEEFHSKVTCSDCGISLEKWQIEKHKETCVKKLVQCEYCELEVPLDNLSEHSIACGSRTEQCLKCDKHVLIKDLEKHSLSCLKREQETMPCEYCGVQIVWHELVEHTTLCGTRTERCFVCSEHVMVQDRDTHFKSCGKDFNDSISCDYCGVAFNHNNIERHVELCGSQAEKCDKCSNHIQKKDMDIHRTICEQMKKFNIQLPCVYCGDLYPTNSLEDHSNKCKSQTRKCIKCDKFILLKNMKAHTDICEGSMSKILGNCPVCHQSVPWVDMNVHSANCAHIYYEAPEYELQNKFNELTLRKESEDIILMGEKTKEKKSKISDESKSCPFCNEIFLCRDLTSHLDKCKERPYNCDMCLKAMPYHKKEMHVHSCRERQKENSDEDNIVHHDEERNNKKLMKLKKCQFCDKRFTDVLFQHHLEECGHRKEKCSTCSENVTVKNMHEHKLHKCYYRLPGNKNFDYVDSMNVESIPEPSKNFERRGYLEEKVELCPSCNCKISEERYHAHLLLCFNEMTRCQFCGEEIKKNTEHFQNCYKILAMLKEDNKSQSTKKKEKTNKENVFGKWKSFFSSKEKSSGNNYTEQNYQESKSWQKNRENYEKVDRRPVKSPSSRCSEVVNEQLPCEFCNEMWPAEMLIDHESGCRPDLVSYPEGYNYDQKYATISYPEGYNTDQKFATAAAVVSPKAVMPVLGAISKNTREENNDWKEVQYRRNNRPSIGENGYRFKNTREEDNEEKEVLRRNDQPSIREIHSPVLGARPKNARGESSDWKVMQHERYNPASVREIIDYRSKSTRGKNNECVEVSSRKKNNAFVMENTNYKDKERDVHQNQFNINDKLFFYSSQDTDEASKHQSSNSKKNRHSQLKVYAEASKTKSDKLFVSNCGVKKEEPRKDNLTACNFSSFKFDKESQNYSDFRKETADEKTPCETQKSNSYHLQAFSGESSSKTECSKSYTDREIKAVGAERIEKKKIMHSKKDAEADLILLNKEFEEMSLKNLILYDENNKRETSKIPETNDSKIVNFNLPTIWNTEYNSNSDRTFSSPLLKSFISNYDNETKDDTLSNAAKNVDHNTLNSSIQDTDYDTKNDETFGTDFLKSINKNQDNEDENDTHSNSDDTFYDADDGGVKYFETDKVHGSNNSQEDKLSHYHFDNLNFTSKNQRDNFNHNIYENLNNGIRPEKEDDLSGYIQFLQISLNKTDEVIKEKINKMEKLSSPCRNATSISKSLDTEPVVEEEKTLNQKKSKKSLLKSIGKENSEDENFSSNEVLKWKKWCELEVSDSD